MALVQAKGMHESGTMMQGMMHDRSGHHGMMGSMRGMMNRMHRWMHGPSDQEQKATKNREDTGSKGLNASDTSVEKRTFRIVTAFNDGLVFRDGNAQMNPTLRVQVGETVEIRLKNTIGSRHDLVIPELNVESTMLNRRGETTTFQFVPRKTGQFIYYCSVPGHREAGMEGIIIVKKAENERMKNTESE